MSEEPSSLSNNRITLSGPSRPRKREKFRRHFCINRSGKPEKLAMTRQS